MKNMQWKCGLLTLTVIGLMGMMNQEVSAQNNEPDPEVEVETTVVPTSTNNCVDGKSSTVIEVDAVSGVVHTIKNVDTDCIEIINHVYNGKIDAPPVPIDATVDPFSTSDKTVENKYDFGIGFFGSGFVLVQSRDDRDGYDETTEEMVTAGVVGTLNTKSWEWSANVGAGGCGKGEVAATAGAALLHKQGEYFGLGPTINLSFCSNTEDPDEELVQLRAVDAGLRLASNWDHAGISVDLVGVITTEPLYIGRDTTLGFGVRLNGRVGWFE